jgi:hypothetical protein
MGRATVAPGLRGVNEARSLPVYERGLEGWAKRPGGAVLLLQFPRLRLRLLQPVRHPHLAVHRRRGGEMLLCLLALAGAPVEFAETEVAVGGEGRIASSGQRGG